MSQLLSKSARRVQSALESYGFKLKVQELPNTTRTADEAAVTIGCSVGQIAKSLVFKGEESGEPILVVACGTNRVNEKELSRHVGEKLTLADAVFIKQEIGFAIGGIPPVGHKKRLRTYLDKDLGTYPEIWAAAGTPFAVFRLTFGDLVRMTGGNTVTLT